MHSTPCLTIGNDYMFMEIHDRRGFLKSMGVAAAAGLSSRLSLEALGQGEAPKVGNSSKGKLNVLVFFVEDQSAHLECLGTQGIRTPHTSRLAEEGVIFSSAFSTCASCAPSKSSLLTGRYPHAHGHWRNTQGPRIGEPDKEFTREGKYAQLEPVGIHEDIPTLVEILNGHGFETAITRKFHLSPAWKYPFKHRLRARTDPGFNGKIAYDFFTATDKPFFFLSQIGNSHRPFGGHTTKLDVEPVDPDKIEVPAFLPDTAAMRKDLAEYFDTVQCTDASVGQTLAALERAGKYDNTLIIFTSDHGFCYHRAKATAYNAGIHVPFIISGPGIGRDERNKKLISHVDVMATVLDYLSIAAPETVQGCSIRPLLEGEGGNWRQYVFAEHNQHQHGGFPEQYFPVRSAFDGQVHYLRNLMHEKKWTGSLEEVARTGVIPPAMLFAGPLDAFEPRQWGNKSFRATVDARKDFPLQYALLEDIFDHPAEELYDLHLDPYETRNLIDNPYYAGRLKKLRSEMDKWMKETGDPGVGLRNVPRRSFEGSGR